MADTKKKVVKKVIKKPPSKVIKSVQMDLFSQFITNDLESVSNTVELWESIPKYFFTPAQVEKLRTPTGHADPYEQPYNYQGIDCTVTIQPALIKQESGGYKAFFPSVTEELIEEALKKILTDQNYGIHDPAKSETWVKFSLYMVQKELNKRGKSRNIPEIKQAIQIMNRCIITLSKGKKELWSGAILQDLVTVDREEYIEDSSALHAARLPLFISHAINKLEYRQYNIDRHMSLKTQLSRWLYKRFVHRYKQASMIDTYHFMYSDVKTESRYLEGKTERNNRKKMIDALEELKGQSVLMSYEVQEAKEGRKIIDVKYTVTASLDFRTEQKAANAAAKKRTHALVDKSK
ncbi:hypothetical protein BMR02_13080 [Methylococcaceae bacterium HT1]|nr:hypothetical protein BMR02_13995 [Methylococcaceae bacterium HT1]TXK95155.1 hypothetical protein BMR02_13080 [Methylococcaceae bacterium HT1]TXL13028.1 hypothetical protein BMR05_13250 [Methylococcaceae bacterium HT4]TXL19112.1 hypothetical protein BMR06_11570 [Methylococcaceae bacterium HT5]TXL21715.1 hypothetical protein BMR03_12410 [Methylococcaceae bacterium HT2]